MWEIAIRSGWWNILASGVLVLATVVFMAGMTLRAAFGSGILARLAGGSAILSAIVGLAVCLSGSYGRSSWSTLWLTLGLVAVLCWMISATTSEPWSHRVDGWIAGALMAATVALVLLV